MFDDYIALNNINCHVEPGDFITIVGPNGAGKTTLFDVITGKVKPTSGEIYLDGKRITHLDQQERAPLISRLFQNIHFNMVPSMTVAENLMMAAVKGKRPTLKPANDLFPGQLIAKLDPELQQDLTLWLETPMYLLSGGQAQLVAFIMATLIHPKLFLLDEPTAALDPAAATKLLSYAARLINRQKITTLLITHEPQLALTLGNKLWVMEDGRITKQFDAAQKKTISPDHLLGHIDYQRIMESLS